MYVCFGTPRQVALVVSDLDPSDFYITNGAFTDKQYEMLSYVTGSRIERDLAHYLAPAGESPGSETEGTRHLGCSGQVLRKSAAGTH